MQALPARIVRQLGERTPRRRASVPVKVAQRRGSERAFRRARRRAPRGRDAVRAARVTRPVNGLQAASPWVAVLGLTLAMLVQAESDAVEAKALEIAKALAAVRRVLVVALPGAPRAPLLKRLAEHPVAPAVVVFPPLSDVDAAIDGLLQAAAPLGPKAVEEASADANELA